MSILHIEGLKTDRICEGGFLESYEAYTKFQESPPDFHTWTGLSLISSCLGRNVYANQGYFKVYPNLFIVLVGKSAVAKKSSALGIGLDLLLEVDTEFPLFSQKVTTESFIQFLSERTAKFGKSEGLIYSPEFSTFLGRSDKDQTLIQTLTDYYDCPAIRSYSTRGRGIEEMKDLCLNLLAGSTPEWLKSSLPEDSIGGGFLSRLLLIHRIEPGVRQPFPGNNNSPEVFLNRKNCLNDLRIIRSLKGEFTWTPAARTSYSDWYCNQLEKEQKESSSFLDGYYGRKGTTVIKLAMNLSAGYSSKKEITELDINNAIRLLNENEIFMKMIIDNMAQSEMGKQIDKVRNIIGRAQVIGHSKLMQQVSRQLNNMELRQIIDTLIESGEIVRERSEKAVVYKATKELNFGG
jgi:hypothetical protein